MSSFTKAHKAQRRTHKERAQPAARAKFGLLEKEKDWKERREDFKGKRGRIQALAKRARDRNPDEFYFAMVNSKTKEGVHRVQDTRHFSEDELKVFKTQDANYVGMRRVQEKRKVERMQQNLHLLGAAAGSKPPNKHTVFVDTPAQVANFDAAEHFDTPKELVGRTFNRPRRSQLKAAAAEAATVPVPLEPREAKRLARKREAQYAEVLQRSERLSKMTKVADSLALEKALMGKGARRKVSGKGEAPVYRWRQERKK